MLKKYPFIKKNDKVIVLAGKEQGKIGNVLKVDSEKGRAIIEKVNIVKRHSRPGSKGSKGGIIEKEAAFDRSNIMLVCPKCDKATIIGNKLLENGKKIRSCKKCGEVIE